MTADSTPQKYDAVQFEFLSAGDEPSSELGTVVVRPGEMVLEVDCPGDQPYVVVGKHFRRALRRPASRTSWRQRCPRKVDSTG